jgi:hypothetical protein
MIEQPGKEQDEEELHQTKPKTDEHEKKKTLGCWLCVCVILLSTQKSVEEKNTTDSRKNTNRRKQNGILKLTMKKELGDCTRRFSLCFLLSSSTGGCSRSISFESTCPHILIHKQPTPG